jgi:hypothetical protein
MRIVKAWSDLTITDKGHLPGQQAVNDKQMTVGEQASDLLSDLILGWLINKGPALLCDELGVDDKTARRLCENFLWSLEWTEDCEEEGDGR